MISRAFIIAFWTYTKNGSYSKFMARKKKDGRKNNGGSREGAGRPKTKEDTKVMRVPLSKIEAVKKIISE